MRGKFAEFFLGLALGFLGVGTTALAGDPRETGLASVLMESTDPEVLISETPDVETGKIETEMGSFQEVFSTKTLPRKGSQIQLQVPVQDGTNGLILEIQEIHNRRPEAFGYTVLVNGKEVYFRTYQELGAGPNHYFVEVPKELLKGHSPLEITLRHDGGGPFSIGKIWVYEDFFEKVAKPEQVFRPMGIIFPTSSIRLEGESESNRRQGEGVELQRIQKMQDAYSGFQDYGPCGFLNFAGGYGHIDPEEGRKGLLSEIGLSSETGMPGLWIVNGTGWGGKPTGADGRGGYFSDIQYTHSTYDPALGTYRASWPNMWGNTPGAALRNPVMNAFLEKRFQQLTEGIQEQLATLRLKGKTAQPMIVREFAPASGEISQAVIEAAARDGVTLDPTDGMSFEERLWMHRDAVRTWQEFADSSQRNIGRDIAIVDQGKLLLPEEQFSQNLYAHPDFLTDKPMNDPRWGGGQHGMVDGLWSSGEMGEGVNFRDIAMYDYLRARGKLSMINMERTILKENFRVMKRHYERGFQFLCFFNADPGDEKFVREVDGIANDPIDPPVHRQPALLDVIAQRDSHAGPKDKLVSQKNMKVHSQVRLAVEDVSQPGELIYKLTNSGEAFTAPLALDLDGRISPGEANNIEAFVGPSPEQLEKVATLTEKDLPDPNHWTPWMTSHKLLDLGPSTIGQKAIYLKIVFNATHAPDAAFLLSLNVQSSWPRQSGYLSQPSLTKSQQRTLQLWTQERAIASSLLKKYAAAGGEDEVFRQAKDFFDRGWYGRARRLLNSEISQLLPTTYLVRGHGRLGRYPIEVKLEHPEDSGFFTIEKIGSEGCVFSLNSGRDGQRLSIAMEPSEASGEWSLRPLGQGRYEISPAANNGRLTFDLEHSNPPKPAPKLPSRFVARFLSGNKSRIQVDTQDLDLMDYASSMSLPLAKDVVFSRSAARMQDTAAKGEMPQRHDEVILDTNEAGEVTAVEARYGYEKGRIKNFEPPVIIGEPSNGIIEMESGNRYELMFDKAVTKFDTVAIQGTLTAYEITALKDAIKPGHEVELRFTPSHSEQFIPRLLEVWQARHILLDVDFTKTTDSSWKNATVGVKEADVVLHKPEPNYLYRVEMPLLRPLKPFLPGSVTYLIQNEKPLGTTAVEMAARAFDDSSRVTVYTSPDGIEWTRCGQFDNTWQNNISQNLDDLPYQFIDITPSVQGLKKFYLKVEMAMNSADHRFCVAKLRVATEKSSAFLP
jgi:hypothetical protein